MESNDADDSETLCQCFELLLEILALCEVYSFKGLAHKFMDGFKQGLNDFDLDCPFKICVVFSVVFEIFEYCEKQRQNFIVLLNLVDKEVNELPIYLFETEGHLTYQNVLC